MEEELEQKKMRPLAGWQVMDAMLKWITNYEWMLWEVLFPAPLGEYPKDAHWSQYNQFQENLQKEGLKATAVLRLDLPELKKVAVKLAKLYNVALPLFYGEMVPYDDDNLHEVQRYCDIIDKSYENAEKVKNIFMKANKVLGRYLVDLSHNFDTSSCKYQYRYGEIERQFALTPAGIEACHDFVKHCYELAEKARKEKESKLRAEAAKAKEVLSASDDSHVEDGTHLKAEVSEQADQKPKMTLTSEQQWTLRQGLSAFNLAVSDNLARSFWRNEHDWAEIMDGISQSIPEVDRESGESSYSLWRFQKMMEEYHKKN